MLRTVLGMARWWFVPTDARSLRSVSIVSSPVLLYLDDLTEVRFVHPVLGLGQNLNVALAETAAVVVTARLALLLGYASCCHFSLLEVRRLVSRVRADFLVGVRSVTLEASVVLVRGVLHLLLRDGVVDGQVLEELVARRLLFADDLLLVGQELLLGLLDETLLVQRVLVLDALVVLRESLAVRGVVGSEGGGEGARVGLLVRADVLQLTYVTHVKLVRGRGGLLHHGHAALLLLVGLGASHGGCLVDFAPIYERRLRWQTALGLDLVEVLRLLGRLESVALESGILFEGLRKLSSLAAASLVSELSVAVAGTALVKFEEFTVILLLLSRKALFLLVRITALLGSLRILATSAVSFRDVIVPELLDRNNFGRLFGSIDL